jgi:hypothetical protein
MARQYLQDDGFAEPAVADPLAANAATTAVGMWNSLQYCVIPAYDSRPGKVYVLEAGGLITTAATGALTISPTISTTNATMLGHGFFMGGGLAATASTGLHLTFGGTAAAYDHSVTQSIWISKTLSVAGSWTTQFVDFAAMN